MKPVLLDLTDLGLEWREALLEAFHLGHHLTLREVRDLSIPADQLQFAGDDWFPCWFMKKAS